jgi:hypothetical protein
MPEPLKNMYNRPYLEKFAVVFKDIFPGFDSKKFMKLVFDNEWDNRELKGRMSHIARSLQKEYFNPEKSCAAFQGILINDLP